MMNKVHQEAFKAQDSIMSSSRPVKTSHQHKRYGSLEAMTTNSVQESHHGLMVQSMAHSTIQTFKDVKKQTRQKIGGLSSNTRSVMSDQKKSAITGLTGMSKVSIPNPVIKTKEQQSIVR